MNERLAEIKARWDIPWGEELLSIGAEDDGSLPLESAADLIQRFTVALNDIAWLIEAVEQSSSGDIES